MLTGEPIPAQAALQWGLVNVVTSPERVLPAALQLAKKISSNAPLAVTTSKRMMALRKDFGSDWGAPMWAVNTAEFNKILGSADAKEGPTVFAEKRIPRWTCR